MNNSHIYKRFIKFQIPLILCFLVSLLHAEEVGRLFYEGDIGELKDSTIDVPGEAVAVSATIHVDMPTDTIVTIGGAPSLFFIIDHSGSMYQNPGNDVNGLRFTTSLEFIDSIKAKFPSAEVGIAVFRQHLYFDPADSAYFVPLTAYPQGAYMPFYKFDSSYVNNGGNPGYVAIKNILRTVNVGNWVDMEYVPTNVATNSASTNINVGFAAARHAFPNALYATNRQFIIFLSDGDATEYNGPNTSDVDFVTDVDGLPTTFTIFFTQSGTAPASIVNMTTNIQSNGYSTNNPRSNLWAIDVANLMDVLMDEVMDIITGEIVGLPIEIIVNGDSIGSSNYDTVNNTFTFDNHFPLTGVNTDFVYKINYTIARDSILPNGDTIVIVGDSTTEGSFSVVVDSSITAPPDWYQHDFKLNCWDRTLGFYFKNNPVAALNGGMDTLEIRFIETKVDTLYNYENVSVSITNSEGFQKDIEFLNLTKTDSCFTGLFPLVLDSTPTPDDGVFQIYEEDIIIAKFRNPDLPLDTLWLLVPFNPTTAIDPNTVFSKGKFNFVISKTGAKQHILRVYNLPNTGKVNLYSINGRKVFEQLLNRGNSSIILPKKLSQALYLISLEYGNIVLRKKLLLQ